MLCLNLLELLFDLWSPSQASEWFAQNHYDLHLGIASPSPEWVGWHSTYCPSVTNPTQQHLLTYDPVQLNKQSSLDRQKAIIRAGWWPVHWSRSTVLWKKLYVVWWSLMTGSFQELCTVLHPALKHPSVRRSLHTTAGDSGEVLGKTASCKKMFGNKWLSHPLLFSPNRLYLNRTLFIWTKNR